MKRKLLILFFVVAALCISAFGFTACGGEDNPPPENTKTKAPAPRDIITMNGEDYIAVVSCNYEDSYMVGHRETEYKLDDGEWLSAEEEQVDGYNCEIVWRNLTPGKTYIVWARAAETDAEYASEAASTDVTLDKSINDKTPEVSIKIIGVRTCEIVGFTDEMEVKYDGNGGSGSGDYIDSATFTFDENTMIYAMVRFKETDSTLAGNTVTLTAPATDFPGGVGTEEDPFLIYTYEQLTLMGEQHFTYMPKSSYFRLENDIECPDRQQPFSANGTYYSSMLDGNNHKITNVKVTETIEGSFYGYVGLFTAIGGVENLTVENAQVSALVDSLCGAFIGIIAGQSYGDIKNCKVSGTVTLFVWEGEDFGEVSDPVNYYIGGLAGSVGGEITGCAVEVKIILPSETTRKFAYYPYCGGLAGSAGNVSSSCANVTVYGGDDNASESTGAAFGGLIANSSRGAQINNSYAEMRVNAKFVTANSRIYGVHTYLGGLVGKGEEVEICNSYAHFRADIVSVDDDYTLYEGGLAGGSASVLENCFVDAVITVDGFASEYYDSYKPDALANKFETDCTVKNCYYTQGETTAEEGATSVSLSDLRDMEWQKQNLGFSEDVWQFHDFHTESGKYYPTLKF